MLSACMFPGKAQELTEGEFFLRFAGRRQEGFRSVGFYVVIRTCILYNWGIETGTGERIRGWE